MNDYLWDINLYENENGICYVESDLLETLNKKSPHILGRLIRKQDKIQKNPISHLMVINDFEAIGSGLWELKFHIGEEIRYLGYLSKDNKVFYALIAFKKKDQTIRNKNIKTAQRRLSDFLLNQKIK